ncbi:SAM-dependent methyltransferase [Croceicoccus naphthovorans]|uniref:Cyclopropane-fatty-acyl-phospholipid synthase n=1 Tax=Croceicoccus naphthovorans TaxID=1348774 RepID=A0A0G3XGA1_9SPHN|nr:cyclopropane-fatty-acyl-phospholipid synthase family protein [Croceicoccus naphthovorans]AKM09639.1 cyclopropane-fatty-acyl-phospholipid synthase [Croceicoccus naphthovorans]MBB3990756.1 cyclopropane-fatty-acyl-phospholipid synthase [Croceicoccus naphthovorans]
MSASESILDRFFASMIDHGVLTVHHASGRISRFGAPSPGFEELEITLGDGVARQILTDPRLGAAEAWMDGKLHIAGGGIMELIHMLRANRRWDHGQGLRAPTFFRRMKDRLSFVRTAVNHAASSKSNVAHHYDIGNDFYRLMLDAPHMQYSCAYWPDGVETLEQAQKMKLAHIAAKLALEPGQRVLDIGCGWGGMAIFLARRAGVHVTGITLSEEQLALARERAEAAGVSALTRFELVDYRDLAKSGATFDRIVSVGMFEHVGRPQFEAYFRSIGQLMHQGGVALVHTIGRMGKPGTTDAFTQKYIFPGGYIPALSETVAASEKVRLIASDVETLRLHYAKTLRCWYDRCMNHKEEIEAMYDPRFFRMWTFYLAGATSAFENGGMCNFQIQYVRDRYALPLSRDYMASAETQLNA